ncbi:hypothetical protein D3C87_247630 [compost metagenome]
MRAKQHLGACHALATISHAILTRLSEAGVECSVHVIGQAGGWAVLITYGMTEWLLAAIEHGRRKAPNAKTMGKLLSALDAPASHTDRLEHRRKLESVLADSAPGAPLGVGRLYGSLVISYPSTGVPPRLSFPRCRCAMLLLGGGIPDFARVDGFANSNKYCIYTQFIFIHNSP